MVTSMLYVRMHVQRYAVKCSARKLPNSGWEEICVLDTAKNGTESSLETISTALDTLHLLYTRRDWNLMQPLLIKSSKKNYFPSTLRYDIPEETACFISAQIFSKKIKITKIEKFNWKQRTMISWKKCNRSKQINYLQNNYLLLNIE